ncbi:MAG: RNA methyltransferase, partial [Firmicutes bacterium]|nr:RNA methyltransferase [Bacillota bacterium]
MKRILSDQNAEYKELEALNNRKTREKTGLFLAEGYHLIREALRAGLTVRTVYADASLLDGGREAGKTLERFLAECEAEGIRVTLLAG